MTASNPFLRNLLIYAVCLPLAVLLGYLLAQPLDYTSLVLLLIMAGVILLPFLLRYHHPLLVLALNSTAVIFLLPGRPQFWVLLTFVSLAISIIQKTLLPGVKFLQAPGIVGPLLALLLITLVTAEARGGISFRSMGGSTVGGRRYFDIIVAVLAYFAVTARRIPPSKALLYMGLFFLAALFSAISSVANVMSNPVLNKIFLLFPPEVMPGARADSELGTIRFGGLGLAAIGAYSFLIARYGLRGIFLEGKPLRLVLFGGVFCIALLGGFRSMLILMVLTFAFNFYLEGLTRTKLLPLLALVTVGLVAVLSPFVSHLPFTVQRAMAFLPLDIDPVARASAETTTEWRVQMWREVLPEVPKYLWLGKGYAMNNIDIERTMAINQAGGGAGSFYGTALASDFHNGPLTLIIPLGIWGALAFVWFIVAAGRVFYFNYKYGDEILRPYNTFLFTAFLAQTVIFFAIFGSFYSELIKFTGLLGMSVSLNGGVCRPVQVPLPRRSPTPAMGLRTPRPALGKSL